MLKFLVRLFLTRGPVLFSFCLSYYSSDRHQYFLVYSIVSAVFCPQFLTAAEIASASGPRRPRARGGASARITRRPVASLAVLLAEPEKVSKSCHHVLKS